MDPLNHFESIFFDNAIQDLDKKGASVEAPLKYWHQY